MTEHRAAAVASKAIRFARVGRSFQLSILADELDNPPSDRTIRRVLRQLEADGWLKRDDHGDHLWQPGPAAQGAIISV